MARKKHRSLGRGLEALLAGAREPAEPAPTTKLPKLNEAHPPSVLAKVSPLENVSKLENASALQEIPLDKLVAGKYQPRRDMHEQELDTLAESIRAQGILQPIVVRAIATDKYEIIAGERRFRAAKRLNLPKIPAIVKEVDDEAALAMALIENIHRENLNALEEAYALERLSKEFSLTHQEIAEAVGKSRVTITNLLRLLTLHHDVKQHLEKGDIEAGHAKVLLGLSGSQQVQAAKEIVTKQLSVRDAERLIAQWGQKSEKSKEKSYVMDPDVKYLQESLSQKLGAPLEIVFNEKGKGKLVIHYNSLDELDGIIAHIK